MEINSFVVRRKIDEAITGIANLMMNGAASWDDYNRLVGQAHALHQVTKLLVEQEARTANGTAELFPSGDNLGAPAGRQQ